MQKLGKAVDKYKSAQLNEEAIIAKLSNSIMSDRDYSSKIAELETEINNLKSQINGANPTGTIISFLGNPGENNVDVPDGYLACDGSLYDIADYTALANQIEKTLGTKNYYGGDGTTTFAVPDLRGEFLRGTGTATRNTGTGLDAGKHQDGTIHYAVQGSYNSKCIQIWNGTDWGLNFLNSDVRVITLNHQRFDVSTASVANDNNVSSGFTSRPTNTAVLYCIKY